METTKKRWISLYVENEIGVLARISGLFSSKSYNIESLTVGVSADPTISRMTIGLTSDDKTFEQVKKQLNRSVEVIKVIDFTGINTLMKEVLFIRSINKKEEVYNYALNKKIKIVLNDDQYILLESVEDANVNDGIIFDLVKIDNQIEIVRGGNVAISL